MAATIPDKTVARIGRTTMTNANEDRTVAFTDHHAERERGAPVAGLVDVPRARLVCTDPSQVESTLPGSGTINLVPGTEQTVGRGETCTYPIGSRKLSRQHARIFPGVGAWGVEDLNSTNGVRVNEEKVQTAWLKQGDVVRFGPIPFRFEIERPDIAGARRLPAAPQQSADGEHTMIFGSDHGVQAAAAMIKAVRESEKAEDEPPPTIVPVAPPKKTVGPAAAAVKKTPGWIVPAAVAVVVAVVAVGGGVYLYPSFMRSQKISAIVTPDAAIIKRVIDHARDSASPTDVAQQGDIDLLQPVIEKIGAAIGDDLADSRELANLYARSKFLVFEREFVPLFARQDTGGKLLAAGAKAKELHEHLDQVRKKLEELEKSEKLTPPPSGVDDPLRTAADLADLAHILVDYRSFARQYPQVTKGGLQPTLEKIKEIEAHKGDLIKYRHLYNNVLGNDYRLFNVQVHDVEENDVSLLGRWRDLLVPGK